MRKLMLAAAAIGIGIGAVAPADAHWRGFGGPGVAVLLGGVGGYGGYGAYGYSACPPGYALAQTYAGYSCVPAAPSYGYAPGVVVWGGGGFHHHFHH